MRLIYLLVGLAIILWLAYTYNGTNTVIKTEGDKTVKQQAVEHIDEAKQAASALQKSIAEQTRLMQKTDQ